MKIYLTVIINVKAEFRTEVLDLLQNMVVETRKEDACELYNLHQNVDNQNQFIFYEIWKNEEGLAQHNEKPYLKAFGNIINEKLEEKPQLFKTFLV